MAATAEAPTATPLAPSPTGLSLLAALPNGQFVTFSIADLAAALGRQPAEPPVKAELIDMPVVCQMTTYSKATVSRLWPQGLFPAPVKTPAGSRWRRKDIERWVEKLKVRDS